MTTISLDILGRDRASKAFDSAGRSADGFSKHIGGLLKAAAGLVAAKIGVDALRSFVDEARESEKVSRITENAIRATGGAAGITAKQVGDLATAISNKTGIDDEQIQTASNMLLTFKNVRNELGAGNSVFDRATQAAADLSIQFGGMDGASKMLGKALNDPIAGITALSRAGVTFTQQQKDQIKALVESGKTLEAQKLILGEVESQVGGAAAAAADPMQKLGVIVGNLKERIGLALLPVVERVADWLGRVMPGALDKAMTAFKLVGSTASEVFNIFARGDFTGAGPWAEDSPIVGTLFDIREKGLALVAAFREHVLPVFQSVVAFVRDNATPVLAALGAIVGGVLVNALIGAATAIVGLFSPVVLAVGAVATLVGGVVYAYQNFEAFRSVVDGVARFFIATVVPAVQMLASTVITQLGNAVSWVTSMWPQISEAIGHVMNAAKAIVSAALAAILGFWNSYGGLILAFVGTMWSTIRGVVDGALGAIRGVIQTVLALINGDWSRAWEGVKAVLAGVWEAIKAIVSGAFGAVHFIVGAALIALGDIWSSAWNGLKDGVSTVWETIKSIVGDAVRWVLEKVDSMLGPLDEVLSKVGKIGGGALGKVGGLIGRIPGLAVGGPTEAYRPYIVGELGPELFVPATAGTVVPNGALNGRSDELLGEVVKLLALLLGAQQRQTDAQLRLARTY